MNYFLDNLNHSQPKENGDVFNNLFDEYWKIIIRSLITTFGLDFLVKDQHGGDVDTIHNVRNGVEYKNPQNKMNYENRGVYDSPGLHSDPRFRNVKKEVKNRHEFIDDGYTPGKKIYLGKASILKETNKVGNLDHVVSGKEIHDDPGRVLAGLDTNDLANRPENFVFTNESLNKKMGSMPKKEFVEKYKDELTPEQIEAILLADKKARESIDADINEAYYSSDKFYQDTINAAHKVGTSMGIREAVGFVMVEILFSCKNEIKKVPSGSSFKDYLNALVTGVKFGVSYVIRNYKYLFKAFGEGYLSGILSSISTTMINMFFTTDKILVKNIRTCSITIVRASNVLFFNPGDLLMGDRLKVTLVILSTGVNNIMGTTAATYISKVSNLNSVIGKKFEVFMECCISGLLSCTFLMMLDRSKFINSIVDYFNKYALATYQINYYCKQLEEIAAKLNGYDIDSFVKDCEKINYAVFTLDYTDDEEEFSSCLDKSMEALGVESNDLDDFLNGNKNTFKI